MQELLKVTEKNGYQLVSARELHEFLESKQDFTTWIKSRIEKYGFVENEDFTLHKFMVGKSIAHDYILKIDMAKELSMVEGNEKGSQARRYFLNCEKKLKEALPQLTEMQMISKIATSQDLALKRIETLEHKFDTVVTLESGKQRKIQLAVASRVYDRLEEEIKNPSLGYGDIENRNTLEWQKHHKNYLFSNIYRDIKRKFGVASYKDIKVVEYEKALEFIYGWVEDKI